MVIREWRVFHRSHDYNRRVQAGKVDLSALFLIGKRQRETERRYDCRGLPDPQQHQIIDIKFANVPACPETLLTEGKSDHSDPDRNRQWKTQDLGFVFRSHRGEYTMAESSPESTQRHLTL